MEIISIMEARIDEKDAAILGLLEQDSSKSKKWIAKRLGIPLTTVHNRVAKLEKAGVITGYRAKIDKKKIGYDIGAYVSIGVEYITKDYSQEETARKIMLLEGVESVAIVAGTTDIIAKVRAKNSEDLNDFLLKHLRKIPGIDKTTTTVMLKEF